MNKRKMLPTHVVEKLLVKSRRRCAVCFFFDGTTKPQPGNIVAIKPMSDPGSDRLENLIYLCSLHHQQFDDRKLPVGEIIAAREYLFDALEKETHQDLAVGRPRVFIGSSREGLPQAGLVRKHLENLDLDAMTWQSNVFSPSMTTVESLGRTIAESAYAIFVFTADVFEAGDVFDDTTARPRDNVIFELGMFIGGLGRQKVALLVSPGVELPSDLLGVSHIKMDKEGKWADLLTKELNAIGLVPTSARFKAISKHRSQKQ